MISAFARASQVIGEPRYLERAEKAGDFIKKFLYVEKTRRLLRNAYRDKDGYVFGLQNSLVYGLCNS